MSLIRPVTPPYIGIVCFRHCRIFARMVVTEVVPDNVVVRPLVLLSVMDHFTRMGKVGDRLYPDH